MSDGGTADSKMSDVTKDKTEVSMMGRTLALVEKLQIDKNRLVKENADGKDEYLAVKRECDEQKRLISHLQHRYKQHYSTRRRPSLTTCTIVASMKSLEERHASISNSKSDVLALQQRQVI